MLQENKTIMQLRHIDQECMMLFHFYCFYIINLALEACDINIFHIYIYVWLFLSRYVDGGGLAEQQAALLHYQQDNLQYLSKEVCFFTSQSHRCGWTIPIFPHVILYQEYDGLKLCAFVVVRYHLHPI